MNQILVLNFKVYTFLILLFIFGSCKQQASNEQVAFTTTEKDTLITFYYNGEAQRVTFVGDISDWNPEIYDLESDKSKTKWSIELPFAKDGRMEYQFVLNSQKWILDPNNPTTYSNMDYVNSVFTGPEYTPDSTFVEDTLLLNKGRLENIVLHNTQNAKEYNGQVYIPFGYVDNSEPKYPFAIFHDGSDYIRFGGKNILDNMIANKEIEPIVALFLDPIERNREYAESGKDKFITFIVEDVLPIIKERYNITEDSKSIASIGNSFGGNISALLSYTHPDKIGLCGSLSGAYWVNDNSTKDFILSNLDKPVRYAAIWGTYEGVWVNNQEIASKMEQNGLKNLTNQVNEGHNWVNWRSQLPQVLKFLFNINTN